MVKVLILGFSGFIGKHLTHVFTENEDISLTVFGWDDGSGFDKKLNHIPGDFADSDALEKALENQDIVYHFISETIPATSWNTPLVEVERNLTPSLKFIELAAQTGVKKICFASSGGTVYGLQQKILTEKTPTEPFSPYGIIKRTIESFLQYAKLKYQMNYDIYRISNVYGQGQNIGKGLGFINTTLENILNNRPVIVYGDGENIRDYIYVKDVARMLNLSISKNIEDSDIYNVSSNQVISLNRLIALIKDVTKIDFEVVYLPKRLSDNKQVVLDNSKIMKHFSGISPVSLEDGIRETYLYLKTRFRE